MFNEFPLFFPFLEEASGRFWQIVAVYPKHLAGFANEGILRTSVSKGCLAGDDVKSLDTVLHRR